MAADTTWQAHEIDVSPEEYLRLVNEARAAVAAEEKRHAEAIKPLKAVLWKLEQSSFYWRSKERAEEWRRQQAKAA